ncbi:hypothetical protein KY290_013961 [Solanum tuberosum]|uniref:Uncharacterized protein n=1 Tax=Solanum tuberosum TaxID=4113 RepID=A0ABQ7VQC6_SOLTU|nr:hypothetical protein KY290_013961 [Solanum tuberosum]
MGSTYSSLGATWFHPNVVSTILLAPPAATFVENLGWNSTARTKETQCTAFRLSPFGTIGEKWASELDLSSFEAVVDVVFEQSSRRRGLAVYFDVVNVVDKFWVT